MLGVVVSVALGVTVLVSVSVVVVGAVVYVCVAASSFSWALTKSLATNKPDPAMTAAASKPYTSFCTANPATVSLLDWENASLCMT